MRDLENKRVVIFGGTGFLGRAVVNRLAKQKAYVTVVARHTERRKELKVLPQVRLVQGDVTDAAFVGSVMAGQDIAVNLVGALGGGRRNLKGINDEWPARLAATAEQLELLIHVSAMGADPTSRCNYLSSKAGGEVHIRSGAAPWVIFSPSVIFGPGDSFFWRFAKLLKGSPPIFPVVRGRARFAPVFVGDVADAIVSVMGRPDLAGNSFELGGPDIWTLHEILRYTCRQIGSRKILLDVPDVVGRVMALLVSLLPGAPLTLDMFRALSTDSVPQRSDLKDYFLDQPTAVESIVPYYLGPLSKQATFDRYRHQRVDDDPEPAA